MSEAISDAWTSWQTGVRLLYNGSDRNERKPSVDARSHRLLRAMPVDTELIFQLFPPRAATQHGCLTAFARKSSKEYFFLRETRLPAGWPDLPNEVDYAVRWREGKPGEAALDPRALGREPTPHRRPTRDETGLELAAVWAKRGTCARRRVGCVLFDVRGIQLGSGYNGPASGEPHCVDRPCPGITSAPGTGLETCEAIHAEQNALITCPDPHAIETAYVTHSPCVHCVKMLLNTSCHRIVFAEPYAHDEAARALWERSGRNWVHLSGEAGP